MCIKKPILNPSQREGLAALKHFEIGYLIMPAKQNLLNLKIINKLK